MSDSNYHVMAMDAKNAEIARLRSALKSVLKSVDDGVIMVRPSERDEFMCLLCQCNDALEEQSDEANG